MQFAGTTNSFNSVSDEAVRRTIACLLACLLGWVGGPGTFKFECFSLISQSGRWQRPALSAFPTLGERERDKEIKRGRERERVLLMETFGWCWIRDLNFSLSFDRFDVGREFAQERYPSYKFLFRKDVDSSACYATPHRSVEKAWQQVISTVMSISLTAQRQNLLWSLFPILVTAFRSSRWLRRFWTKRS